MSSPQLAYIGLGNIGRGMCLNLVQKGNLSPSKPLILYNRTTSRAEDLADHLGRNHTRVVTSVTDAVAPADIIFICLGSDAASLSVMRTILEGGVDVTGKVLVEVSTLSPETVDQLGNMVTAKGGGFVASPVWGPPIAAETGQLISALAGPDKAAVDRVRPYLTGVTTRAILDFSGESWGKACLAKVVGNTFMVSLAETLGQGLTLAEKTGLGVDKMYEWFKLLWPGPYVEYGGRMVSGAYWMREEPHAPIDVAMKDARHALELAEATGTKLYNVELGLKHLEGVKERMGARGDMTGIYGMVREASGLPFENESSRMDI